MTVQPVPPVQPVPSVQSHQTGSFRKVFYKRISLKMNRPKNLKFVNSTSIQGSLQNTNRSFFVSLRQGGGGQAEILKNRIFRPFLSQSLKYQSRMYFFCLFWLLFAVFTIILKVRVFHRNETILSGGGGEQAGIFELSQ